MFSPSCEVRVIYDMNAGQSAIGLVYGLCAEGHTWMQVQCVDVTCVRQGT